MHPGPTSHFGSTSEREGAYPGVLKERLCKSKSGFWTISG
jgi:hypothetical protein